MGTLPIMMIKGFRLRILPAEDAHYHRLPVVVLVITLMIGMQAPMISCSGGADLARPYLFRDFEMLTGYAPQHSARTPPTLFQHQQQKSVSDAHYSAESAEDGSSEEGEETQQYTAPIILDIDDPEERARWMGLTEQQSSEEYYDEYEDEPEQRSLSSTEFMSRSSQQIRSSGDKQSDKSSNSKGSSTEASGDSSTGRGDENRGIMDNFNFNPFSYWQGESEDDNGQVQEMPQSDEMTDYGFYPYAAYGGNPLEYYYDQGADGLQNEQIKNKPIVPYLAPQVKPKPKPSPPKVKPVAKKKPKPVKKVKKPKPKPKPPVFPPAPKPKPMKMKNKEPQYSSQFHYQEYEKQGKLAAIGEKLSKLNPFRYVQIQKPQIKIETEEYGPPPPPQHHHQQHGPPPRPKPPTQMKKPKRPPPKPKPPAPPSMLHQMMNKMKPKPSKPQPKLKRKKPKKPQDDEANPEFVMIFGEPFGDFSSSEIKGMEGQEDYRNEDTEDDDEEADDDDNDDASGEDEEEDDEDEEDDEYDQDRLPQVTSVTHGELPSGEMTEGEAEIASDDGEADGEEAEENTQPEQPVEDDEGDYEDGVIGLQPSSSSGTDEAATQTDDNEDPKEKSISFTKVFGWRKKKKKRRRPHHHRPHPARRPPGWKQYRPAPLLPEFPEKVHDAVLTVIKNVGFLPEYDKTEKYGGHNKIKGKFTKTRPITLHHGLLTEVLRRRRR